MAIGRESVPAARSIIALDDRADRGPRYAAGNRAARLLVAI
jgi:hypothetical protein